MAKLFEQGSDISPELNKRVAWGSQGTPTSNSTWQTIVTWLESVLGFLKTSSNLSDINDPASARTNLDVYSTGELDAAIGLKADASNVLERDNIDVYNPTAGSYQPATTKYVDDKMVVGTFDFGNAPASKVVSIGKTLPNTSYRVFLTNAREDSGNYGYWATIKNKTTTTFTIEVGENVGVDQNLLFDWLIIVA